jgi:hypothetical protein
MANDVSGFGLRVALIASVTFPAGIVISQFSNDVDPLDFAAVKIGDVAMGLNGDLITWAKAVPLPMILTVIPGSADDTNLQILAEANRVGQGKISAYDIIDATVIYPDGSTVILTSGKITDATFGRAVLAEGKQKTRPYSFQFQNQTVTPATAVLG